MPLASGARQMGFTNGSQGAPLTTPLPLTTGQIVWLVWGPQGGAQASTEGNGAGAQPYRASFDGGQTWNGPFRSRQWKFRAGARASSTSNDVPIIGSPVHDSRGTPAVPEQPAP